MSGKVSETGHDLIEQLLEKTIDNDPNPTIRALIDCIAFTGSKHEKVLERYGFLEKFNNFFEKVAFVHNSRSKKYSPYVEKWFNPKEYETFTSQLEATLWLGKALKEQQNPEIQDILNRKDEIREEIRSLFKSNLRVTDYDVPEADDQEVSELLIALFSDTIEELKNEVLANKYENY